MTSKFAWVMGKRGLVLAIAVLVTAVLGYSGHSFHPFGLWDGPA